MSEYPIGATLRFADPGRNVLWNTDDDGVTVASGRINGEPFYDEANDTAYIPCFCERDNGREPTTIYVHEANILSVETKA